MIIETQFVSKLFDRTKIQTCRVYQQSTANIFVVSSRLKLLVPVQARGYGHRFTIGHILITYIYKQNLHELSESDLVLEGLPDMSVDEFVSNLVCMSKHKITMQTSIYVYTFVFFPLSQKRQRSVSQLSTAFSTLAIQLSQGNRTVRTVFVRTNIVRCVRQSDVCRSVRSRHYIVRTYVYGGTLRTFFVRPYENSRLTVRLFQRMFPYVFRTNVPIIVRSPYVYSIVR